MKITFLSESSMQRTLPLTLLNKNIEQSFVYSYKLPSTHIDVLKVP